MLRLCDEMETALAIAGEYLIEPVSKFSRAPEHKQFANTYPEKQKRKPSNVPNTMPIAIWIGPPGTAR
jgi:hypothetical protein